MGMKGLPGLGTTVMRQTLSRFPRAVYVGRMTARKAGEIKPKISPNALVSFEHRVERAAGDFRRGVPVLIASQRPGESALALSAETADDVALGALAQVSGKGSLILTHARAATLKIRLYTAEVISIPLSGQPRAADLRAIADPATDLEHPLKG